ncbi:MAG: hypothetical protein GY898_07650 [Proteobacteria bacterium]|nr:hypothetical protein [Pseudomonadota bacterium]
MRFLAPLLVLLTLAPGLAQASASSITRSGNVITIESHIELWGKDAVVTQLASNLAADLEVLFNRSGQYRQYKCYRVEFVFHITTRSMTVVTPADRVAFRADDGAHHLVVLDVSDPAINGVYQAMGSIGTYFTVRGNGALSTCDVEALRDAIGTANTGSTITIIDNGPC